MSRDAADRHSARHGDKSRTGADAATAKDGARRRIEAARAELLELSHTIHANPELQFEEIRASGWAADMLETSGLAVERGVGGLETAFAARAGRGPLHVVVCAEYDALPAVGHACGHNVIAAAAVGAGLGLAAIADDVGLQVTVLGTPAEEGGAGKAILLEQGAFDGAHAALMVHPGPIDALAPPVLAAQTLDITYRGREAHAAAFPELGVNAADALVVAQTAIGLLRQHLRATDRVHGIVTKGGDAPNIVPAHTTARYMVRAATLDELVDVRRRVLRCFEAGSIATGATVEVSERRPYAHMLHDQGIAETYARNAVAVGRTFPDVGAVGGALRAFSTDMGNVSLAVPSIHPIIGIDSLPAVNHQPEFAAHCAGRAADRAVLDGAVAMAWTAIDLATDDASRARLLRRDTPA